MTTGQRAQKAVRKTNMMEGMDEGVSLIVLESSELSSGGGLRIQGLKEKVG